MVQYKYLGAIIVILSAFLFTHSLGNVSLFDWDEINFAESAREMIVSGNYYKIQVNYEAFWEKPPLFFWMQVISMKIFGINEFAARFPNAVCGVITLLVLFLIGKNVSGNRFGLIWVCMYGCSLLPHFYFKSGIIDPWFNLFIFLSLYFISQYLSNEKKLRFIILSGLFAGFANLTKGPVGILIIILTTVLFLFLNRKKELSKLKFSHFIIWVLFAFVISCFWFLPELLLNGSFFIREFIKYQIRLATTQDAGHGGFLLYHFLILLIGCFPSSVFIFSKNHNRSELKEHYYLRSILFSSLCVILFVFTLVKTKIVHYSSFAYFPITFLASFYLYEIDNKKSTISKLSKYLYFSISILWGLILILLPLIGRNIHLLDISFIEDKFFKASLANDVKWPWYFILPGIFYMGCHLWYLFRCKTISLKTIVISNIILIQFVLNYFIPRIEGYTQNSYITFLKTLKNKDVFIYPIGFKSYAHFFYSEIKPGQSNLQIDYLKEAKRNHSKPVYFIAKEGGPYQIDSLTGNGLELLYTKNGYIFLKKP